MKYLYFLLIGLFCFTSKIFALNELIVRVPDIYTSHPGFIDKATLVIEPHGGYAEQSLYLQYSDHHQFSAGQQVEVIHRFELPQGAVINDLWLWIGDSVMQAIMLDTWTARSIYDSIVSMKRDPAFLTKKGNQYELHIYPMVPGGYRKIKINYITPTRWIGTDAFVELPLGMLQSNNNTTKPLDILYRVKQNIWGIPSVKELPGQTFTDFVDTLGLHYKFTRINDITTLTSFKLGFNIDLLQGTYFKSGENTDSLNYFQLSFLLKDVFSLAQDSSSKKALVALDLSSAFNKNYTTLIPQLKTLLKSSLKQDDYFNLLIAGAGRVKKYSPEWLSAKPSVIDEVLDSFESSPFADSISYSKVPRLLYADDQASQCWNFPDINLYSSPSYFYRLYSAADYFNQSDIIASYTQGHHDVPSGFELPRIIAALDSFFLNEGRFVTYFDFNRDGGQENVATHYIKGLSTKSNDHNNVTLYRNVDGNIGLDFPESIDHAGTYFLQYNDSDVKVELRNANGDPAVISKKVGRGLIVVSGIWSFNDDAPLRKLLAIPLLGLNKSTGTYSQLPELLGKIKNDYSSEQFDKVLLLSNSDSLILENPSNTWADNYTSQFGVNKPIIHSINLLNGIFSSVTVDNIPYYGSGYLLKRISDKTNGLHFETRLNDWDLISSLLSPYAIPALQELNIITRGDNDTNKISDLRQIKQVPADNNSPLFFIGAAKNVNNVSFNISAKFQGIDSVKLRSFTFPVSHDTTNKTGIISSMLGYEKLKDLFAYSSTDTAQIVDLALKYNLLCDYTALLALEPNDTIHFLHNPLDEGGFTSVEDIMEKDSLQISVFPNPFNNQTKIMINAVAPSELNIYIYNILGQLINTIAQGEEISGIRSYFWNGTDMHNSTVSSGVYLMRVVLKNKENNKETFITHKLLLLK